MLEALNIDGKNYYVLREGYPPRSATGYSLTDWRYPKSK